MRKFLNKDHSFLNITVKIPYFTSLNTTSRPVLTEQGMPVLNLLPSDERKSEREVERGEGDIAERCFYLAL